MNLYATNVAVLRVKKGPLSELEQAVVDIGDPEDMARLWPQKLDAPQPVKKARKKNASKAS